MKKILLLLIMLVGIAGTAFAHPDGKGRPDPKKLKELRDYKIKYLAQEMELTDEQKPKFVELYEKMSDERMANFDKMRAAERKLRNDPSDAEYKAQNDIISNCKVRDAQIIKEYDAKFEKFLSAKQLYKMKEAEETFRKRMRDMHHKRKQDKK